MAQSAVTVTPPNPTPPTNFGSGLVGGTPPTTPGLTPQDDGVAGSPILFAAPASGTVSEGAGTEVSVVAAVPNPAPSGQLIMVSDLGNYTTQPNQQHASSLSPAVNPTLASISPTSTASGAGTQLLTATGTGFNKQSQIVVNGVPQATTFVSATSLTATVNKKATAGAWPVTVVTGGVITTAPQTWTFT
jgi:hypothetical protein